MGKLGKAMRGKSIFWGERVVEKAHVKKHHPICTAYKKVYTWDCCRVVRNMTGRVHSDYRKS